MRYRTDYHSAQLSGAADCLQLGPWRVQFLAFSQSADDLREPVLLIGGAFQCFRSFASETQELLQEHPVILLDLPSQGSNLQLAPELSLEGLADLIAAFISELQLPAVKPIGLSYGSAVAALFAARHPQHCSRLLLAGITTFGRPGSRLLLEEGLKLLDEGRHGEFAQAALNGLINPLHCEKTGVSTVFRRALLRQIQRLSAEDILRYRQNSRRLLDFKGFASYPNCPTLILAGQYDHFTQPWEHSLFAQQCTQGQCVLIHQADHLAQFEQKSSCSALYRPFLTDQPLPEKASGSSYLSAEQWATYERRQEPRQIPKQRGAVLQHSSGLQLSVEVVELGFFGVRLKGQLPSNLPVRNWQLLHAALPPQPMLILRHEDDGLIGLFVHSHQDASQALATHLQAQATPICA